MEITPKSLPDYYVVLGDRAVDTVGWDTLEIRESRRVQTHFTANHFSNFSPVVCRREQRHGYHDAYFQTL